MTIQDYLGLPYTHITTERNDGTGRYYYGEILEFQGCSSHGETLEELDANLKEQMKAWLEIQIEDGVKIPLPTSDSDFNGKYLLRMPKSLHRRLSVEAQREGVSFNQYALYKLSAG